MNHGDQAARARHATNTAEDHLDGKSSKNKSPRAILRAMPHALPR